MMLSSVLLTSFMSCRLAPSMASAIGMPTTSVSKLRLTHCLPRSIGFGPVFEPATGALVITPSIYSQDQSIPLIPSYRVRPSRQKASNAPTSVHSRKRRYAELHEQMPVASRRSTGSRSAAQTGWHSWRLDLAHADCGNPEGAASEVTAGARPVSIARRSIVTRHPCDHDHSSDMTAMKSLTPYSDLP